MVNEACQGFASCFAASPQSASCAEGTLHAAQAALHKIRFALTDEALLRTCPPWPLAKEDALRNMKQLSLSLRYEALPSSPCSAPWDNHFFTVVMETPVSEDISRSVFA